ncbi:hypothetical protein CTA2_3894 [Colletotrichum tanaceti]|uniref:Uncharacterized protein n=1 Tax=Colletotrichum tanaceti TaxID=1306861 RepID=A0A4V6DFZ7_9PEZI|nr:hypothetical protein CTA2_3894 [Colletotrichum tanaceti]TKW50986.1 hypothetical protein CTA1_2443 [Colletotrichum tanaceti]
MKLSSVFLIVALALTSAEAEKCKKYKRCWCRRDQVETNGTTLHHVAWDAFTAKACEDNGGEGRVDTFDDNTHKECYRYKKGAFWRNGGINLCEWRKRCVYAGKMDNNPLVDGVCRNAIASWKVSQSHPSSRTTH